nr:organic cation transporter protein-like [Lepeophtheirus salmonis]
MAMREGGDSVDFDNILSHIGEMGRYQLTLYLLLCIPATLPAAFLAFNQVFISAEPQHWCKVGALLDYRDSYHNISSEHIKRISIPKLSNVSKDYHKCIRYVVNYTDLYVQNGYKWPNEPNINWPTEKCMEGWIYDRSEFKDTLVTELDLVCEKNWWPSTSTALFYVGSLFGNILFGHIADKYGRRTSFFILLFMEVTLAIATSFSPNYVVFTVLRSINGFTFPALFQIPFILSIEIMGPGYRTFAGMMICLFFAVALMILAGLAYIFNSWFSLALATSTPFVLLFSYWFFVPESPRWLLSYNRVEEAEVIIQSIAKWNKKEIPENFVQIFIDEKKRASMLEEEDQIKESPHKKHHVSMLTLLLRYPIARRNFILITFNWLANALVYNGLSFYSANLNVSSHLGFFISSVVEIPSYLIGWYVMDKWGRRWILFATMMTGGISCICCIFVPINSNPWITVSLAMIGKFQIAASFAVIYVYAGELMPTVVRSEAMGISSFVAGIGLLIFPYINSLGDISQFLPLVIMGTLSVMGGITALFLPETLGKHLPNTLEEGEGFGNHFSMFSCPQKNSTRGSILNLDETENIFLEEFPKELKSQSNGKIDAV